MATGFNLFDFSSLGGNQLNKAVSNQKLPTTAPAMPGVVPKFSPVQNTIGGEARISNTPSTGIYDSLYNKGADFADWFGGFQAERKVVERQGGMTDTQMQAVVREMRKDKLSDEDIATQLEAIDNQLKSEYKQQEQKNYEQASPIRKLAGGAVNLAAGNLQTLSQYGGNILDVATLGQTGIGEDVSKMMEQNKDIYGNSTAFKAGTFLPDVALGVSPIGGGYLAGAKGAGSLALRSGAVGAGFGATQPILEQGSNVDIGDIAVGGAIGGGIGAVAGPVLGIAGKGIVNTADKAGKYGTALYKGGAEGLKKSVARDISAIKAPGKETITRNIPKAIIRRELGFTPTERRNIEKITGIDEGTYLLQKGLAGKGKEELADIFMKQSDDMYNGITTQLSNVQGRVESKVAKEALLDILDQLESSPKIARAYAKDIEGVKAMLSRNDFSLSELNNIRRAYDKVNTGMFTVQGKARSGLENAIDVKVRQDLSSQLQKEAKKYGVDVKAMNTELRAGLEMKDALLRRLSQEERNNFIGLQDLGVSAILSGGEPISAVATIAAKKYAEKIAPGLAQKAFNLNKAPNVTRNVSRGNTITPRNKSSKLGLASNPSDTMVRNVVTPKGVPKKVVTKLTPKEQHDIKLAEKGPMSIPLEVSNPALAKKVTNKSNVKQPISNPGASTNSNSPSPKVNPFNFSKNKGGFIKIGVPDKNLVEMIKQAKDNNIKLGDDFLNLSDKDYEGKYFMTKKDSLDMRIRNKPSVLRDGESPISTSGDNTEKVARERFDIPKLEKLGAGSDRDVYDLGNGKILKVSKTARGLEQTSKGTDFYLQDSGVVPEVYEQGRNYVVTEKIKTYTDMSKEERSVINKFVDEMQSIRPYGRDYPDMGKIQEVLEKYGWEDLANYDMQTFGWGDIARRNLGIKNGRPILIDEGTIDLTSTIKKYQGVKNLDDAEFKDIYQASKEVKKRFGDIDKNTMYNIGGTFVGGNILYQYYTDRKINKPS